MAQSINNILTTVHIMLDAERLTAKQVATYPNATACFCYSTAHDINTGTVTAVTEMLDRLGIGYAIHDRTHGICVIQINK